LAFSTTNILLAIIAIMSFVALQQPDYFYKWAYDPYLVKHRGQYWRLLTHQFIHADLTHLLFNGFALYSFGNVAEALFQIKYPQIPFFYVAVYGMITNITFNSDLLITHSFGKQLQDIVLFF
jgi:membrane associated rhomboid family serine protease